MGLVASSKFYLGTPNAKGDPQPGFRGLVAFAPVVGSHDGGGFVPTEDPLSGFHVPSHELAIGDRWIAVPGFVDIGPFTEPQSFEVHWWNNHEGDELTILDAGDIVLSGDIDGVSISGITTPLTVGPTRVATLLVSIEGGDTAFEDIDAIITITARNDTTLADEVAYVRILGERRVPTTHLLPQWASPVGVVTAWDTRVESSFNTVEMRRGRQRRPSRVHRFSLQAMGIADSSAIEQTLLRSGNSEQRFPLACDVARLTSAASEGATVLACPTANRRFFAGGRVLIAEPSREREALFAQQRIALVASVADGAITLDAPLSSSFPSGSRVYPAILGRVAREASFLSITDHHASGELEIVESDLDRIPALVRPGLDPGDAPPELEAFFDAIQFHSDDRPIFDPRLDWATGIEGGIARAGDETSVGLGQVVELRGSRAVMRYTLPMLELTRAAVFDLLRFYDWRGGGLHPFWFLSPRTDFDVRGLSTTTLTVRAVWSTAEWTWRPYLGFRLRDGSVVIRTVASVAKENDVHVLSFDSPVAFALADVRKFATARLCRFASDLEEEWETDELARVRVSVVEIAEERDVTIA